MIICPKCMFPIEGGGVVVAERDLHCGMCHWSGPSSAAVLVPDGKFQDPRVFNILYELLGRKISPAVGAVLLELGLVTKPETKEELRQFTQLLINYTRAGFESLLHSVLGTEKSDG